MPIYDLLYLSGAAFIGLLLAIEDHRNESIPRLWWLPIGIVGLIHTITSATPIFFLTVVFSAGMIFLILVLDVTNLMEFHLADYLGMALLPLLFPNIWIPVLFLGSVLFLSYSVYRYIKTGSYSIPFFVPMGASIVAICGVNLLLLLTRM